MNNQYMKIVFAGTRPSKMVRVKVILETTAKSKEGNSFVAADKSFE